MYYVVKESVVKWWAGGDGIFFTDGAFMPSHGQGWAEYYLKGYRKFKNIKNQDKE